MLMLYFGDSMLKCYQIFLKSEIKEAQLMFEPLSDRLIWNLSHQLANVPCHLSGIPLSP